VDGVQGGVGEGGRDPEFGTHSSALIEHASRGTESGRVADRTDGDGSFVQVLGRRGAGVVRSGFEGRGLEAT